MKRISILTILFISWFLLSSPLQAIPKYTDKANALNLAKVLDKGYFKNLRISSTYVLNDSAVNYYISVILSDGSAHKWYINQIFDWSRSDQLRLTGNRNLVFLQRDSTQFKILPKNLFHRTALQAKVFVKTFGQDDPLSGQKIHFRIKAFNLISPKEKGYGVDKNGDPYRYILDLLNGTRELLTFKDAYILLTQNRLLPDDVETVPTQEKAYHLTRLVAHAKKASENTLSQFGIEMVFDKSMTMEPEHFPIEIYEKTLVDRRHKKRMQQFFMDITIPNAEKKFEIKPIGSHEYLHHIHVTKDTRYPKRLLLRASFNPNVMNIAPVISKVSDRSVYISLFHSVDQTIYNRKMLLEESKRRAQEKASEQKITVSPRLNTNSDYGKAFLTAVDTMNSAIEKQDSDQKIDQFIQSMKQFESAGLMAENDQQLLSALEQRNTARTSALNHIFEMVESHIAKNTAGENRSMLLNRIDQAETLTQDKKQLAKLDELRKKVNQ